MQRNLLTIADDIINTYNSNYIVKQAELNQFPDFMLAHAKLTSSVNPINAVPIYKRIIELNIHTELSNTARLQLGELENAMGNTDAAKITLNTIPNTSSLYALAQRSIRDLSDVNDLTHLLSGIRANQSSRYIMKTTSRNRRHLERLALDRLIKSVHGDIHITAIKREILNDINPALRIYNLTRALLDSSINDTTQNVILSLEQAEAILSALANIDNLDIKLSSKLTSTLWRLNTSLYLKTASDKYLIQAGIYGKKYNALPIPNNKKIPIIANTQTVIDKINLNREYNIRSNQSLADITADCIEGNAKLFAIPFRFIGELIGGFLNIVTIVPALDYDYKYESFPSAAKPRFRDTAFGYYIGALGESTGKLIGSGVGLLATPFVYGIHRTIDYFTSYISKTEAYGTIRAQNSPEMLDYQSVMLDKIAKRQRASLPNKSYHKIHEFIAGCHAKKKVRETAAETSNSARHSKGSVNSRYATFSANQASSTAQAPELGPTPKPGMLG